MRLSILFITLLALNSSAGVEFKRIAAEFYKYNSEERVDLKKDEALFEFKFQNLSEELEKAVIQYSIDGVESKVALDNFKFKVKTTPGKHRFIIYINGNYQEMYSDSLSIKGGFKDSYYLYPRWGHVEVEIDKPIIYLYPEVKTDVKVLVDPTGEFSFTYPEYKDGWNVTAHSDGTIEHNGNSYNYLFWESTQTMNIASLGENGGYLVKKQDLLGFLEGKLDEAGFTSKEKADFITYWAPRMMAFDELQIEFIQNSRCDQFAKLDIQPQPDHVNRFYMTWGEAYTGLVLTPSKIQKMDRSGFDVLEWGGQELPNFTHRTESN